jgi:DNA-binding response OmpR family regulator
MSSPQWLFGGFRLDLDNACLWHGAQAIALTPKAFDVLHYLVTHPDRLVSKDTLLDAVWPETAVSDTVVRIAIGELRAPWAIRPRHRDSLPPCLGEAIALWRPSQSTPRRCWVRPARRP